MVPTHLESSWCLDLFLVRFYRMFLFINHDISSRFVELLIQHVSWPTILINQICYVVFQPSLFVTKNMFRTSHFGWLKKLWCWSGIIKLPIREDQTSSKCMVILADFPSNSALFGFLENKLLLISINFTPKTSHSCPKKRYTMFSRLVI